MIYQGNMITTLRFQQQQQQQMQEGDLTWPINHTSDNTDSLNGTLLLNSSSHFLNPCATAAAPASNDYNLTKTPSPSSSGWVYFNGSASQLSTHHYNSSMVAAPSSLLEAHQLQHHEQHQEHLKRSPEQPIKQSGMRIGLDLGRRTYFSTEDDYWPEKDVMVALLASKRPRLVDHGHLELLASSSVVSQPMPGPLCQALGCRADLSTAKHYHRRHKVCEMHSKASMVTAPNGETQRFCQQCSRFHALLEFDEGKRSCRKRLADHNRRRRKPQQTPPRASSEDENHGPCKGPADVEESSKRKYTTDTGDTTTTSFAQNRSTPVVEEETEQCF